MSVAPLLIAFALAARPSAPAAEWETTSRDLPNIDAFLASGGDKNPVPALAAESNPLLKPGGATSFERRLGVPTFLWASKQASAVNASMARWSSIPEQVARGYLAEFAPFYRLTDQDAAEAVLTHVHNTGKGAIIVKFRQEVGGVEVFRNTINVVMNQQRELVAVTGYLSPNGSVATTSARAIGFPLPAEAAVASAFENLNGSSMDAGTFYAAASKDRYDYFNMLRTPTDSPAVMLQPARVKKVLFDLPDRLEPAYYVELETGRRDSNDSDSYSFVISANDGQVLFRNNLTAYDAYTYRVWADASGGYVPYDGPQGNDASPHPTGVPNGYQAPFVPMNDVTLQNAPFSRNDPWLPPGATETVGNNTDAYADLVTPDGYGPVAAPADPATGDFRAQASGPNAFTYTFDPATSPANATQRQAAITELFFVNNFLHDWYYDSGFDEAAGNAQALNFGRGGLEADSIKAEAQDFGGRNNANMNTPSDGARPRMQMYVWDPNTLRYLDVNAPASIAGRKAVGTASFGAPSFNLTGEVAAATPADGCSAVTGVTGKIALLNRGTCPFSVKAAAAQSAGAIGVIIANNAAGIINMSGSDPSITVPVLSVLQTDGAAIRNELTAGNTVNVTMFRQLGIDRDGTVDNSIIAHEWAHYLSNRLVGNANGLSNTMGRGMGEGWSDFNALIMTVKASDLAHPANANWTGAYAAAAYVGSGGANNGYYWGIRRTPYSVDFAKNPLTFKHIQNGTPLPTGVPISSGQDGANNAEVHNTGEIWANMLWESYVSLLRDSSRLTFDQAQARMKAYLVAGLKMTPNAPTLVEARDAILAAAYANDTADFNLIGAAFARRGAGIGAVSPDRSSSTNVGVVESYLWGNDVAFVDATLDDSVVWCDRDGYLDNGETGKLTIRVKNVGATALSQTRATITSSNSAVSFSNGGVINFSTFQPYTTATGSVNVTLSGATSLDSTVLTIAITDPTLVSPRTITGTLRQWTHVDDIPASTATESAESRNFVWTAARNPTLGNSSPWKRLDDTAGGRLYGPDPGEGSDQYLVSPPLNVSATGSLRFTFRHKFDFEADPPGPAQGFYDGGRIELSNDDGATWTDIGARATPTYNHALATYTGNVNPLAGQQAYAGRNASYPAYDTVTVDLGTAYQGQTVKLRFRVATDGAAGGGGWEIDDVAFTGIDNTPFGSLVSDRGLCINRAPSANAGTDSTVPERSVVHLNGSGSSDPDGDTLAYTWMQTMGPPVTLTGGDTATPRFTAPEVTSTTLLAFSLVVSDGSLSSSAATVSITVRNVNRGPMASAGEDLSFNERGTATLDASNSGDPDGDAVTYSWAQTGGPTVTLSDTHVAKPTFTTGEVTADTTLTFEVTVSDGELTGTDSVTLTIRNVNRAPIAEAGDGASVQVGDLVRLHAELSRDPDGDTLTYSWQQTMGTPATLSSTTSVSPTFTAPDVPAEGETLTFEVTVKDPSGASATDTVSIHVTRSGGGGGGGGGGGCGCSSDGSSNGAVAPLLLLAALGLATRRRRAL